MEIHELAAIMEKRLDNIEEKMDRLWDADGNQKADCRQRHTALDIDMSGMKVRQSIIAVIASVIAAAVASTIVFIERLVRP